MQKTDIPVCCTLTQEDLPSRRALLLKLRQAMQEVWEQVDGFTYRFASDVEFGDPLAA